MCTIDQLGIHIHTFEQEAKEGTEDLRENLSFVEKVCDEFFSLRLPLASEILDVAAGSGIVSAKVQSRGYCDVDALDGDMETLMRLKKLMLYRNFICRDVKGVNSTGLRPETYDVVITAGGFAHDAISPHDITEMLRLLKEEGYLLWTMKTCQAEGTPEFGLFQKNLVALERQGLCVVEKHETFADKSGKDIGVFYLVRRCGVDLTDIAMTELPTEFEEQLTQIMVDNSDPANRVEFYDKWSDKYDNDLVIIGNYTGHIKCAEAFVKLGLDRSVAILDLAAGTGLLGAEVTKHGYVNIDGLDAAIGMLNQARKQNIYQNYILASVKGLGSIPLNDRTYDVILSSSGFAPGQIYPSDIPELLRILRPGGYILFTMRDGYQNLASTPFGSFDAQIEDLVRTGVAELLVGPVIFQNFLLEHSGRFYMLKKPATHTWALASPHDSPTLKRRAGTESPRPPSRNALTVA